MGVIRNGWRDAVGLQVVLLEKIHLEKFSGKGKLVINTINGEIEIDRRDYEKRLKVSKDNSLYIVYNVIIEGNGGKVRKKFKNVGDKKVMDRVIISLSELRKLGYEKYKYGTYKRLSNRNFNYILLNKDNARNLNISYNFKRERVLLKSMDGECKIVSHDYFLNHFKNK